MAEYVATSLKVEVVQKLLTFFIVNNVNQPEHTTLRAPIDSILGLILGTY